MFNIGIVYRCIVPIFMMGFSIGVAKAHNVPINFLDAYSFVYGSEHIYAKIKKNEEFGFGIKTELGLSEQLYYASAFGFDDLVSEFFKSSQPEEVLEGFIVAAEMNQIEVLETYIEMGVDPKKIVRNESQGGTNAFHHAAKMNQLDVLRYFVSKGMDVNSKTPNGLDALTICVIEGQIHCVLTLLELGAEVENSGWPGNSVIDIARKPGFDNLGKSAILMALEGPGPSREEFNAIKLENEALKLKLAELENQQAKSDNE